MDPQEQPSHRKKSSRNIMNFDMKFGFSKFIETAMCSESWSVEWYLKYGEVI